MSVSQIFEKHKLKEYKHLGAYNLRNLDIKIHRDITGLPPFPPE
jgi:hypothetical protein